MISLSILMDFCSSWYWWWILPFLFGILLGYVLWAKYKRRAEELEGSLARYQSTVTTLEADLNKSRNDRTMAEAKLTKVEEQLGSRDKQVSVLNKEVLDLKKRANVNINPGGNLKQRFGDSTGKVNQPVEPSKKTGNFGFMGATGAAGLGAASMAGTNKADNPKTDSSKPVAGFEKKKKKDGKNQGKYKNYNKLLSTNLQIIEGIGPKLESILKENGIGTWKELSSKSRGELRAMLESYGSRYSIIDPAGWPRQAFKAMNSDWEGLVKIQTEDGSDSKLRKVVKKLGLN